MQLSQSMSYSGLLVESVGVGLWRDQFTFKNVLGNLTDWYRVTVENWWFLIV
jgi:hypothetical protein